MRLQVSASKVFILLLGLCVLSTCHLSGPSVVTPEGLRVYIPHVLPGKVIPVECASLTGYSCYLDSENDWSIALHYKKFEDDKYWDDFYSLEHQMRIREEIFCSHSDRITNAQFNISASEFEVYGSQTKLNVDGNLEPEKHFFYYEYICPAFRFRCEIGMSYTEQRADNLNDWADQFKDIRHEIVR